MGRILSLVLGLAVLSAVAYKVIYGRTSMGTADHETPKQALDNVKQSAKRIEAESAQKAADDLKAGTQE
jgi:hypothetical protein